MITRNINVVHVLVPRRSRGEVQFLLSPHPRWRDEAGRPLLALPAKKTDPSIDSPDGRPLNDTLEAILREDLGLPEGPPQDRQQFASVQTHLVSPAFRTPTTYAISPLLARVPAARHGSLARRVRGEWLTPEQALGLPELSPTARLVLERAGNLAAEYLLQPPTGLLGSPRDRNSTEQLLAARDGDMSVFGELFEEIAPLLRCRLRSCTWTRTLTLRPTEVDDALNEAVVKILENLETFDPGRGTALGWLWSITRNCAVSALRLDGRHRSLGPAMDEMPDDRADSDNLDPVMLLSVREELALVQDRIAQLLSADPLTRRIWEMRFVQEMPYAAIAAELNMPMGSVATRIHRVRQDSLPEERAR